MKRLLGVLVIAAAVLLPLGLLARQQAPSTPASSDALLAAAMKTAQAEQKAIYVYFGASWCSPCLRLHELLETPQIKAVMAKHFVVVPLTIFEFGDKIGLNNPGAEALHKSWGGVGIPLAAVLDAKGARLPGTADTPTDAEQSRAFVETLQRAAPRMTSMEATALLDYLLTEVTPIDSRGTVTSMRLVWRQDFWGRPAVSADGRLAAQLDGDLFVHDFAANTERPVTKTSVMGKDVVNPETGADQAAFSRDGKWIAYNWEKRLNRSRENAQHSLRVVSLDGQEPPRELVGSPDIEWIRPHDWSPDGQAIAVQLGRRDKTAQIALVSVRDGSLRILKAVAEDRLQSWIEPDSVGAHMKFSPDGRYLAIDLPDREEGPNDVLLLATDGSREIPAVVHPANDVLAGWSPDGQQILFQTNRTGTIELWAVPFGNGVVGQPAPLRRNIDPTWRPIGMSTSGTLYYYAAYPPWLTDLKVAAFDWASGRVSSATDAAVAFAGTNSRATWSPDGRLAFVSDRTKTENGLVVVGRSMTTGQSAELRPVLTSMGGIVWSPDGRSFAAVGMNADRQDGVYRVDAQTGATSFLTKGEAIRLWSPDNKLFFERPDADGKEVAIVERDLASGHEREVYRSPLGPAGPQLGRAAGQLSPDGRTVFFRRPLAMTTPPHDLIARDLASGTERTLVSQLPLGVLSVSPDGRFVATKSADKSSDSLLLIPTAGGEVREVPHVALNGAVPSVVAWAPDSSAIMAAQPGGTGRPRELWWYPLDGRPAHKVDFGSYQVLPNGLTPFSITTSPDGHWIAFRADQAGGPKAMYDQGAIWAMEFTWPGIKR